MTSLHLSHPDRGGAEDIQLSLETLMSVGFEEETDMA
jgi:hypothetical protein